MDCDSYDSYSHLSTPHLLKGTKGFFIKPKLDKEGSLTFYKYPAVLKCPSDQRESNYPNRIFVGIKITNQKGRFTTTAYNCGGQLKLCNGEKLVGEYNVLWDNPTNSARITLPEGESCYLNLFAVDLVNYRVLVPTISTGLQGHFGGALIPDGNYVVSLTITSDNSKPKMVFNTTLTLPNDILDKAQETDYVKYVVSIGGYAIYYEKTAGGVREKCNGVYPQSENELWQRMRKDFTNLKEAFYNDKRLRLHELAKR
jgi:hypothetical protein